MDRLFAASVFKHLIPDFDPDMDYEWSEDFDTMNIKILQGNKTFMIPRKDIMEFKAEFLPNG